MQSEFERRSHEQHMKEANERLNNRNQYIYESIKGKIDRDVSRKKQNEKEEMKAKRVLSGLDVGAGQRNLEAEKRWQGKSPQLSTVADQSSTEHL